MEIDITAAAIATIISSSVSTFVALRINKTNSKKALREQLDGIVKIAIQYPYLESSFFTGSWKINKDSQDERYLRYESYCTLVFNYLSRLCEHYNFKRTKIENHLNVRDWIRIHKQCWQNPSTPFEHADGYSKKLKEFLGAYLK